MGKEAHHIPQFQHFYQAGNHFLLTFRKIGDSGFDDLKMIPIEVHVADSQTSVLHPASSTHRQLTDEQLIACGVEPGMVRLSCGLESVDDIIADLEQAFAQI